MKPTITSIDINNGSKTIGMEKKLFYADIDYYDRERKCLVGDMGFAICDQADTRNDNDLEDNISNTREWVKVEEENGYDYKDEKTDIIILSVWEQTFYDETTLDETDDNEEAFEDWTDWAAVTSDKKDAVCKYAVALCTEEMGKALNLEKIYGHPLDYYYDED